MHGIRIETNAYVIELVCHDLVVTRLATGDPVTGELTPVD
jgi:recombinational DNA repair protein RecR